MPRVEGLADVTRCDPVVVLIERLPSELPADEHTADQLVERKGWVTRLHRDAATATSPRTSAHPLALAGNAS
jgi:hypothetical protein